MRSMLAADSVYILEQKFCREAHSMWDWIMGGT